MISKRSSKADGAVAPSPAREPSGTAEMPTAVDLLSVFEVKTDSQDLGFELIVSYLRQQGLAVAIAGYPDHGNEPLAPTAALKRYVAPILYWHLSTRADYQGLREAGDSLAGCKLVAGGDFATRHDREILEALPEVDAIVRGEVELTLEAVVRAGLEGAPWRHLEGLSLRADGGIFRTPPRPLLEDLDQLTGSRVDFFQPPRSSQAVLTSRGCNSDCQYCGLQVPNRREFPGRQAFWRSRSAKSIVDEIELFHRTRGVTSFHFNSFVFFGYDEAGSEVIREVAEDILDRRLQIEFRFVTLARDLYRNRHLLSLLKRAGLAQLTLGVDSGLDRALELYQVGFSREQIHGSLEALAEQEIPFYTAYIFYDPYLALPEIRDNLDFIRTLAPYYRHMNMPFAYFADQQFLGTTLQVRSETPIYPRLVQDGVAEKVDPLLKAPRIGFRHPEVGRLFQVHQAAAKLFLPRLRPLLFRQEIVSRYPDLDTFPLDLLRRITTVFEASPEADPRSVLPRIGAWIREQLGSDWEGMLAGLEVDEKQRQEMDQFFDKLGALAGNVIV